MALRPCALWWPALLLPALAAASDIEWPSCVEGSPPLRVSARAPKALLNPADRARFEQAARSRYPLYDLGRRPVAQVVLVQRGRGWQYLSLWSGGPTGLCLAAAFAAERFDFTPAWLAKYQPQADESLDD